MIKYLSSFIFICLVMLVRFIPSSHINPSPIYTCSSVYGNCFGPVRCDVAWRRNCNNTFFDREETATVISFIHIQYTNSAVKFGRGFFPPEKGNRKWMGELFAGMGLSVGC